MILFQENQLLKDANIISSPPQAGMLAGSPSTGDYTGAYYSGFKGPFETQSGMLVEETPFKGGIPVDTKTYEFSEPTKFFKTPASSKTSINSGASSPASSKTSINSGASATASQFNENEIAILESIFGRRGAKNIIANYDTYSPEKQLNVLAKINFGQGAKSALSAGKEITKPRGSFFDLLKEGKFGEAFFPREMTVEQLRASLGEKARYLSDDQLKALASRTKPSILAKYAPPLIAGIGGLYAAGGFKTNEDGPTRATREQINKYSGYNPSIRRQMRMAAGGGEMYPERIGAIAGPGTGVSDDVPALLSDGEFVMTAKAVRGAGNGSRDKGVRKMYQMMRRFEGGAV